MPFLRRYAIIDVEIASGGIRVEIKTAAAIGMGAVGTVYAKRLYDQYGSHFFAIADHERAERLRSSGVTLDGEAFFPQICEPEQADGVSPMRSEESRVGKECRSRWSPYH